MQLRRNSIFVAEKFFLPKVAHLGGRKENNFELRLFAMFWSQAEVVAKRNET